MLSSLQLLAEKSLQDWIEKLEGSNFMVSSAPTLVLNQRGRIAGAAVLQKNIIKLQPKLFAQNTDYFLSDVIPHELAHIAVFQHCGRVKPHGKEWQYVMRDLLRVSPKVTHTLDVKKAGIKMHDYECRCGKIQLTSIRHNRVVAGKQSYICKRCRNPLILAKVD